MDHVLVETTVTTVNSNASAGQPSTPAPAAPSDNPAWFDQLQVSVTGPGSGAKVSTVATPPAPSRLPLYVGGGIFALALGFAYVQLRKR